MSDSTLTPGQTFTIDVDVHNRGTARSDITDLRYYRSTNSRINDSDTEVGTELIRRLDASDTTYDTLRLTAPSSAGTYYYGACVDSVRGESDTRNNCSDGVRVRGQQ